MESTLASIIAAAAPLVYVAVGETITERAGIVNLSLDGSILISAMSGFAIAFMTGSVGLGFVLAASVSAAIALLIAWSGIQLKLNQIAVGFVLALLTSALASYLGEGFVHRPGPSVTPRPLPGLVDLPVVGRALFGQNLSIYGSLILVVASGWFLARSRWGLELRSVGERPEAAHARGVNVNRNRYLAALVGGALVGVGGAAFSLDQKLGWSDGHTAGFGWIALAIVIFGGWQPLRVALGCYLFGALQVVALRLQSRLPGLAQILPSLPFPLMIFALVVVNSPALRRLALRSPRISRWLLPEAPAALGRNFVAE
ncbi:MAG: ABC transporter permease [Acidimicrobiia bacterium]